MDSEALNEQVTSGTAEAAAETDTAATSRREVASAEEVATEAPSASTRRADFERLIGGEYKDLFTERVSGIINRRFAEQKRGEAERERREAEAASGFAERSALAADGAESIYAGWLSAAEELKGEYPDFSVEDALKEPAFGKLLRSGVDMRVAFEATNMEAVKKAVYDRAAADAQVRTLESVRLRGMRPDENGARGGAGIVTGGMKSLSRAERAVIADKAMRGLLK